MSDDGSVDARAVAGLGAALGLVVPALVAGLLLPEIDERAPAAIALGGAGLLLAAGAAAAARASRWSPARLRLLGLATALGGLASAAGLPFVHRALVDQVSAGSALPGSILVGGAALAAGAAFLLPLGALAAVAHRGRARPLAALLVGLAGGLLAAPWLVDAVFGAQGTLRAGVLLAAAASLPLAEAGTFVAPRVGLGRGAAAALVATGVCGALLSHLLPQQLDVGAAGTTWLAGCAALGAAAGLLVGARRRAFAWSGVVLAALPWTLGFDGAVLGLPRPDPPTQLALLAALGALLGFPAGAALGATLAAGSARDARSTPSAGLALLPALLLLAVPATLVVVLPRGGAWVATALLLALAAAGAGTRPTAASLAPAGLALALALVPLSAATSTRAGLRPVTVQHLESAVLATLTDPLTGATRLALDGLAPLARSAEQEARMVHLPLTLAAGQARGAPPGRVLVVAQDRGQAAATAFEHGAAQVDWLATLPDVGARAAAGALPGAGLAHGNERLHLLRQDGEHGALVLLPDLRVRRRAGLLGTREHFELLLSRLAPRGLFCQWFDLGAIDVTDLKAIVGSAVAACPHVLVLLDHPRARQGLLGIVGSPVPFALDLAAMDGHLAAHPAPGAALAAVGLDGLRVAALATQAREVLEFLTPAERSLGDLRPGLGVGAAGRSLPSPETTIIGLKAFADRRCDPLGWIAAPPRERAGLALHTADLLTGWQHLYGGAQAVLAASAEPPRPFEHEAAGATPEAEAEAFLEALATLSDWPYLRRLVREQAEALLDAGRGDEAEATLRRAVGQAPASAELRFALASVVERRGDSADACLLYGTVLAFAPEHEAAREARARLGCE